MSSQNVVIFGTNSLSSLAWYCLTHDSPYQVMAFTVDAAYLSTPVHEGLPVVPFEEIKEHYPPETFRLLVPVGFNAINGLRRERYEKAGSMGYEFVHYVSSHTNTWPDFHIGDNCLIYESTIIQPFATIGDNVIIRSGVHISHHCQLADHVFVAAGVTLGGHVKVGEQAFLGLGAIVRDGITIAERSFIGAGAVVISDTESDAVYVGSPARKTARCSLEVTGG